MERDRAHTPPSSSAHTSGPSRLVQLFAIANELSSLLGQNQRTVARRSFTALVRATGVNSGRIFLTNKKDQPEYCLVLANGHLDEYDETTCPPYHEQALAGWAYRQRRGVLITNTASDPRWSSWAESPEASLAGSALAVPILIATQPIGALALVSEHANHFTETDLALITNLADQVAIIIENARLTTLVTQRDAIINGLSQSTHTISTSVELNQMLFMVLRQLIQSVPYPYGMVLLREGERLRPATVAGWVDVDEVCRRSFNASDVPNIFHALSQGRTVIASHEDELGDLVNLAFPRPVRTWAITPLVARSETLGGVILASPHIETHDDYAIPTIDVFVDHIAIAVSNHRLALETDRRLQELAFLNETGQAITSTLDLDRILHLLLERVRELLRIDAASIALRDEQTGELVFEAASGEHSAAVLGVRLKPGQGIAGWVAETGKPLVVQDVYRDARFFPEIDKMTRMRTQAILCIPIVLKGRVVGVIEALNPRETPFDEQSIELLNALSGLAATAIDNARLFAEVRSTEARYESLFEDSANPIILTDLNGTIVEANRNACTLLGQTKEALYGTNLTHLRTAADGVDFKDPLKQIRAGQEIIFQTVILSDGHRTTIEIKGKRVLVRDTPLIQWIGRNISAEIELEQTREDMVRMLIHDLRNPLANIINSLDVLYDVITEKDTSVPQEEILKIARRSAQRMQQLISTILDISRLETGQAILQTQATDLVPLLRDAVEFIKPQTDIRQMHLTESYAPNLPQVEIDNDMITRVLLNLLDNACKYTQMGGTIGISANALGAGVEVAVADNGVGIPADQLKNIFEKFTRVRQEDGPKGTGLGLAFCKLAIEAHGGHIWAESIAGQGTTIRFTLPVDIPPPAEKSKQ